MKKPWTYLYTGTFTQYKRAVVHFHLQTDVDSNFELMAIWIGAEKDVPFTVQIPQLSDLEISPQPDGIGNHIVPGVLCRPGHVFAMRATMVPGTIIGRKRPMFQVVLRGVKVYI